MHPTPYPVGLDPAPVALGARLRAALFLWAWAWALRTPNPTVQNFDFFFIIARSHISLSPSINPTTQDTSKIKECNLLAQQQHGIAAARGLAW